MVSEDIVKINLLEVILRSMKSGSKYPYELSYLSGTLANILKPSDKKRDVSFDENQLGTTVIADLKDLYNCINNGQSWRGIRPVIAICNPDGDGITDLIKPEAKEDLIRDYPLIGSALGSVNTLFGSKDECIIIGNYDNEPLMRTLRSSINPKLKINYDIPNGFISRALYDLSEQAVAEIGKYTERYGSYFYVARSTSQGYKVTTNFYYSQTAVPNEVIKREFKFNCISTDPQYGSAPFEVRSQVIQGENNPKIINVNTNKVVGFSTNTHLMDKVFSSEGDSEFMKLFSDAIDRTYKFGNTSMVFEDKQLNFAEVDGNVLVEDPANQDLTQIYPNPSDPNDMQMQALQVGGQPTMDPTMAPGAMVQGMPTQGQLVPAIDTTTGQPMLDPNTGQPLMEDPATGMIIDPATGQPVIDPTTGQPMIDPNFLAAQAAAAQGGAAIDPMQQPAQQPPVTPQQVPNIPTQQANPMMIPNQQFSNLNTDLMNKLFSDPKASFAYEFTDAFNAAKQSGHSILVNGDSIVRLFSEDGETVVADDNGQTTIVKANEAGQIELEPGDDNNAEDGMPYDDITKDIDDPANPDAYTKIDDGVVDEDKAGLEGDPDDSFTGDEDKAFSDYYFALGQRIFGDQGTDGVKDDDIVDELDGTNMEPENKEYIDDGIVDKDKAGLEGNPSKSFSNYGGNRMFSDEDIIADITEKANALQEAVSELEETKDPELAEQIQELADDLKDEAEIFEGDEENDTEDVRIQCNKWVKLCSDVISENKLKEGSLERKTVVFTAPKDKYGNRYAPKNNFMQMLYSGTDILDDPTVAEEGEVTEEPVAEPEVTEEVPQAPEVIEDTTTDGTITVDNGNAEVTVDPSGDVDIDLAPKSFSNTTKTFAQTTTNKTQKSNNSMFKDLLFSEF